MIRRPEAVKMTKIIYRGTCWDTSYSSENGPLWTATRNPPCSEAGYVEVPSESFAHLFEAVKIFVDFS